MAGTLSSNALATDVALVGLFPGKALIAIDGGAPRILSPGQSAGTIKLVSLENNAAVIESGGKRERIQLGGQPYAVGPRNDEGAVQSITLVADGRGHFVTTGSINGAAMTFLVDTGASSIAMSTQQAKDAGINYTAGARGYANTANGLVQTWVVNLDKVTVNGLSLQNVEAIVIPSTMGAALLGMTFLNRLNMTREGNTMVLKRRY